MMVVLYAGQCLIKTIDTYSWTKSLAHSCNLSSVNPQAYSHSQFIITWELDNIWLGRNGADRNNGEGCNRSFSFFFVCFLCWIYVASKDSGISCLPNKGINYVATAQHFHHLHFGTIVQQPLPHLCDASHMLDTLRHINSATNRNRTQVQLWSIDSVHSQAFHVNSTEFTCSCTQSAQTMAAMCLAQTALSNV